MIHGSGSDDSCVFVEANRPPLALGEHARTLKDLSACRDDDVNDQQEEIIWGRTSSSPDLHCLVLGGKSRRSSCPHHVINPTITRFRTQDNEIPKSDRKSEQWCDESSSLRSLNFDATQFSHEELASLVLEIFLQLGFESKIGVPKKKLQLFIGTVRKSMFENPYHDWTHVADVVQATYALGMMSGVLQRLTPLEQFALMVSALCHDLEHPGVSNLSLAKTKPNLRTSYTESSLERHHSIRAFSLMVHRDVDFLSDLDTASRYKLRDMVNKLILATDMSRHAEYMSRAQTLAHGGALAEDHQLQMELLLKCADTSNVVRPIQIAKKWAVKIADEFFAQGDLERSMGWTVTPHFDRHTQTLTALQTGFIDGVMLPFYCCIVQAWPSLSAAVSQLQSNRAAWAALTDSHVYASLRRLPPSAGTPSLYSAAAFAHGVRFVALSRHSLP